MISQNASATSILHTDSYLFATYSTDEMDFKCSQCEKVFPTKDKSRRHHLRMHENKENQEYDCTKCDKVFHKKDYLSDHIISVHTKHECPECKEIFVTRGKRDYHVDRVHRQLLFECNQCDSSFVAKGNLKQHIDSVHEQLHYVTCTICNIKVTKRTLPKHQEAVHDNIKNFECDKCDYKSYSKQSLADHNKYKHDKIARTIKVVTCQHCHKEVANLEWHVKKIHTLIRHKCNKCEKEYIAKHHLDEHVKSVHEEKNIECLIENCNFKAGILSRLKVHMKKVHCENKPSYPCPNCDHKSSSKSGLEKHIQYVHLKAPKASCDICGTVVRGDHLKRHMKSVHYNPEHGVSCHRCGKMLKDEAGLRGHLKR